MPGTRLLSPAERKRIEVLLNGGMIRADVARRVGRSPNAISCVARAMQPHSASAAPAAVPTQDRLDGASPPTPAVQAPIRLLAHEARIYASLMARGERAADAMHEVRRRRVHAQQGERA